MKRKFIDNIIYAVLLIFLLLFHLFAQDSENDFATNFAEDITNRGTSAAAFLEIGVGARALGLGGAFTALANDASALYWNPAGLVQLESISLTANHTRWLASTNFEFFGIAFPFTRGMALGIGIVVLDYIDKQPVRTIIQPEGTGEFYGASDMAISSSFAMSLIHQFSFGITAKYVRQEIWHESANGFAVDIGVLYKTRLKGLTLGTSISNFGTDMQMNGRDLLRPFDEDPQNYSNDKLNVILKTDSYPLPLLFRFGISYSFVPVNNHGVALMMDLIHPSNNVESMNLGIEYSFMNLFSLRAGYQSLFDETSENGLTLGTGIGHKFQNNLGVSFNYAYSDWGLLGNIQRFSIDLNI